ncbi:MAG: formate dehydrogenase subunit gamma [Dehalococcoidia bacterium]|nr:MAG: formate dehydrogenase subunit gamma [Dehalococcoidia bacterium]
MQQEIQRYRKPTRILHWVHAGAFVLLFLTGLILFIPQLGILAQDSWTRVIHRIAAAVFIIAPLIYIPMNWKATKRGIKLAFSWGADDIGWLQAAPRYYFLGDEKAMPPQGHMNTGQKMWWFMVIVFGIIFVITGLVMWFAKGAAPAAVFQWMVFVHDIAFIVTGTMLFLHIYLGVFHPLMASAWDTMVRGKVSAEYAKAHHGKWYEEVTKGKEVKS